MIRVYFQFENESGAPGYAEGTYTVKAGDREYEFQSVKTDIPNVYYYEFPRPDKGDTIAIDLESSYPNLTQGGGLLIWAGIYTDEEAAELGEGFDPPKDGEFISHMWETKPDTFPLTKSSPSTPGIQRTADGTLTFDAFSFRITMQRDKRDTLEGMGKDLMRSAVFEDVLTLPDGVSIAPEMLEGIERNLYWERNGAVILGEDTLREWIKLTNLDNLKLSVNEAGQLVIRWTEYNKNPETEIPDVTLSMAFQPGFFVIDPKEFQPETTYIFHNEVTVTQEFTFSPDQTREAECTVSNKAAEQGISLAKERETEGGAYNGEAVPYRLTLQSTGAVPYDLGGYTLTDHLNADFYIKPEDLEGMFAAAAQVEKCQLAVTIQDATFCQPLTPDTVSGETGGDDTAQTGQHNTSTQPVYDGKATEDGSYQSTGTLYLTAGADGEILLYKGGPDGEPVSTEGGLAAALEELGFITTAETTYKVEWIFLEDASLRDSLSFRLPATLKDTFMSLPAGDQDNYLKPLDKGTTATNSATLLNAEGDTEKTASAPRFTYTPDLLLDKSASLNGQPLEDGSALASGQVVEYNLNIRHWGSGSYDPLPVVDQMTGTQILLVPVEQNANADWAIGLETVEHGGQQYYLLEEGEYKDVWIGGYLADTVTVTGEGKDRKTLIKWYFTNFAGRQDVNITYPVLVEADALSILLKNESWLNDHPKYRLYDSVSGLEKIQIEFEKKIVEAVGDRTSPGADYSPVAQGQQVVYRLKLASPEKTPITLTGDQLWDTLPPSLTEGFRWAKGTNVALSYGEGAEVVNEDNWSIEGTAPQQTLRWGADFKITFSDTAYIFVTLTFPSDEVVWETYCNQYGGTQLVNTFYVLGLDDSVTHDLATQGKVRLQKGVYSALEISNKANSALAAKTSAESRVNYVNDNYTTQYVAYYVTLHNQGPGNFYLTELQDILPRGFTLEYLAAGTTDLRYLPSFGEDPLTKAVETTNFPLGRVLDSKGTPLGEAAQRAFTVTATTETAPNGRQKLTFRFSGNAGASEASALTYNSTLELYYLRPGEVMQFGYVCRTNEKEGSDDVALNSVAMPYYDFSGAGVEVDSTNSTVGSSPADGMYTNDGECDVISNAEAGSLGFAYDSAGENPQWLLSQVTMRRGQVQPGITKKLASRTDDPGGTVTPNPSFARPTDLLTWEATVENSGLYPIMDYVLSDQVQGPYGFEGKVNCQIYQPGSNWKTVGAPGEGYLFEIQREGDTITLVTPAGASKTITPNGEPVPLTVSWKTLDSYYAEEMEIQVALQENDDGGEAIFLRFPEDRAAIPEAGGYAVLTLSTKSRSSTLVNTIYMNEAYITPLAQQDWDSQVNQGNYTELETPFAELPTSTVRNSAQVAVSHGYMTSSLKAVEEVENTDNRTDSNRSPNYILLEDQGRKFTYTLTVVNDGGDDGKPIALDKLILIDNLPEPGDHSTFLEDDPRNSEFEVCLAEDPNFQVTVTPPEGDPTTLPESQYETLPADVRPNREVTYEGKPYYLMRVDESQAQGLLTWSGLEWDDYLWVEVKAPEGYNLNPTIQRITYPGPQEGTPLQVTNEGGFQLPETGSGGPLPYLISGSALSTAAVLIWRRKKRTERGSGS